MQSTSYVSSSVVAVVHVPEDLSLCRWDEQQNTETNAEKNRSVFLNSLVGDLKT